MLFTFFFYFDTAKIYTFFYLPTVLVGKCAIFLKIIFIITENQQLILTKKNGVNIVIRSISLFSQY